MESSQVIYKKQAVHFIKKNKKEGIRFLQAFKLLAEDFNNVKLFNIKRMKGRKALSGGTVFRLKFGDYRAIFERQDSGEIVITVIKIAPWGDIYND